MIKLSAFRWSAAAQGLVRDIACAGRSRKQHALSGEVIGPEDQASAGYRALQPFGQVPAIETGELFQIGRHRAAHRRRSRSADADAKDGRELGVGVRGVEFGRAADPEPRRSSTSSMPARHGRRRRPMVVEKVQKRLAALGWLGGRDYLEDRFTAGDLLMTTVLRTLRHTGIQWPAATEKAYQERCEARPAFQKAMADHLRPFQTGALSRDAQTVCVNGSRDASDSTAASSRFAGVLNFDDRTSRRRAGCGSSVKP